MSRYETDQLAAQYDAAAPAWADKMRALGYYDAYCGFLVESGFRPEAGSRVLDIGAGTAAFAEAWAASFGADHALTLLEPSAAMLDRGVARLSARGVVAEPVCAALEDYVPDGAFDALLAAHVIEHGDPAAMLRQMRGLARPGAKLWLAVSKPHWCNAIIWFQWRHVSYRAATVRELLSDAGWRLEAEHAFPGGPPSRTSRGYFCTAE